MLLGTIKRLWCYPIKSMLGEFQDTLVVNKRGIEGDRLFAIRDVNGKFGSGKNTRRFRHMEGLLSFQALYQGDTPMVKFPDGRLISGDDPVMNVALSDALEQPVTLANEADISHLDDSPIHLLTSASLARLQRSLPDSMIDERRFRANLIIDLADGIPPEDDWVSRRIRIGNDVVLEVTKLAERCVMASAMQTDLPHDPAIFRHIVQQSAQLFGLYADVVQGGVVKESDSVYFESSE